MLPSTASSRLIDSLNEPAWYSIRTQQKQEGLAGRCLARDLQIETFAPRIRYRKLTRRGLAWFNEALFPNYIFARFAYADLHRYVTSAAGVHSILRFGDLVIPVPENVIAEIRACTGDSEELLFDPELAPGDSVKIIEGAFSGMEALVTQAMPGTQRVQILLDFLGRQMEIAVCREKVISAASPRQLKVA